jgi:SPW repeat
MRIIPTRVHAPIDFLIGVLLIAAPWIFGFSDVRDAEAVSVIVGAVMLASGLMTNYELGALRVIPMHVHVGMDAVLGVVLAASPWIFGFADRGTNAWLPLLVIGLGELAVAAMSDPWPGDADARRREERLIHRTA